MELKPNWKLVYLTHGKMIHIASTGVGMSSRTLCGRYSISPIGLDEHTEAFPEHLIWKRCLSIYRRLEQEGRL